MIQFAVFGALVRYQPIQPADNSIKPVDPALRMARLGN
jgi:hypothetical protein